MGRVFYVTIEGSKQGRFKGESVLANAKGKIEGLTFSSEVASPRDAATGQASGKRIHSPIMFTKQWGAASPQLFQATVTNEVLKSVLFEFVGADKAGKELVFETVKLTNATIADLKRTLDEHTPEGTRGIDQVALVFQKIEITDTSSKTTVSDDWQLSSR
jgi:type VI secretion system secreted protein Hcp